MNQPIKIHDQGGPVWIFPEHISVIFPSARIIVMDCVHGDGNGLLYLDKESFDHVMKAVDDE